MKFTDKTILITGGGSGIGRALAKELFYRGNTIIICGRREHLLEELAHKLPGLHHFVCDISESRSLRKMAGAIKKKKLVPSILINNAAILHHYQLDNLTKRDIDQVKQDMATNLFGPVELTALLLSDMLDQSDPMIINMGSPVGIVPLATNAFYSASKAALHSYTQSLRYSLKGRAKVIEVFPPVVATDMSPKIRREMQPDEFARKMLMEIEKGKEEIWVGDARILRFLNRMKPGTVVDIVNNYNEK